MSKFIIFAMLSLTLCKASDLLDVLPKNTAAITTAEAKKTVDALWASSFSKRPEGTAIQKLTTGFRKLIENTTDEAKKASASCAYLMWFTGRTHGFSTEKSEDIDLQSQLGTMQLIARNVAQSMVAINDFSEKVAAQHVLENMFTTPFSSEAQHAKQTNYQDQTIYAEVFKNLLNDMGLPTPKITPNTFEGKLSLRNIWEKKVNIEGIAQTLAEIMGSPQRTRMRAACDSLTATVNRLTEELENLENARKQEQASTKEDAEKIRRLKRELETALSQHTTPARNSSEDQAMSPCTPEEYYALQKRLKEAEALSRALQELQHGRNTQADASKTPQRDAGVQTTTEGVPATDEPGYTHRIELPTNRKITFEDEPGNVDTGKPSQPPASKDGQDGSDGSGDSTGQTKQTPPQTPISDDHAPSSNDSGQPSQSLKSDQDNSNKRRAEQAPHELTQESSGTLNPDSDSGKAVSASDQIPSNNDHRRSSGIGEIASQTLTAQGRVSGNSVMNNNFNTPVREALAQAWGWFSPSSLARFLGYSAKNLLTIPAGDALVN